MNKLLLALLPLVVGCGGKKPPGKAPSEGTEGPGMSTEFQGETEASEEGESTGEAKFFRLESDNSLPFAATNWTIFQPRDPCGKAPASFQINVLDVAKTIPDQRRSFHLNFVGTPVEGKAYVPTRYAPRTDDALPVDGDLTFYFYVIPIVNGSVTGGSETLLPFRDATVTFTRVGGVEKPIAVEVKATSENGEILHAAVGQVFYEDENDKGCDND